MSSMHTRERERGAAIDIVSIKKCYGAYTALDNVSLHIKPGEFMTFLGPSGSGKTTTLNVIAGFTDLTSGDLRVGNKSISNLPAHKRNIGVVFQHYALFPHMTVGKNIAYPLKLRGVPAAERERLVQRTLSMVKLEQFAHRYPSELSGGQQQRVALARSIVFDPPLLLMDEPLGALDKKLREWLQLEIKRIHRELGGTFVFVTHDQEEALILSDRIAVFNRGRIEQVGTGRELYDDPATLFVGKFIGESTTMRGEQEVRGGETAVTIAGERIVARRILGTDASGVILVRPEQMTMATPGTGPESGYNRLRGRVKEAIYLGSGSKYQVQLGDGTVAAVRAPLSGQDFRIDDDVDVAWPIEASKLLADDAHADFTLT